MSGTYMLVITLAALSGNPGGTPGQVKEDFPGRQECEQARTALLTASNESSQAGSPLQATCVQKQ